MAIAESLKQLFVGIFEGVNNCKKPPSIALHSAL
jgi:hypothetical protein